MSCSECGRGICPDCMVFAPVGIRCPDHASIGAPRANAARTVRQARGRVSGLAAPVTSALIAINVLVYLITVGQGGGINAPGGSLFLKGELVGYAVGQGDWWRLFTAMFLHGGVLHIAFNMFALWWLGSVVEQALGPVRFLLLYLAGGLAGSAGALVIPITHVAGGWSTAYDPLTPTVGASGAIFAILGALLVLEHMQTGSLAGQAMSMIVLNLALSAAIPNISIGGHLGGLIGGVVGTVALSRTRYLRPRYIGPALVVLVGVISVALAIARAKSYI